MAIPTRLALFALLLAPVVCVAASIDGKVISITDGDTVTVLDSSNEQHKIRLAGIDAPEKKQAFGDRAKQAMAQLVFGRAVDVEWSKRDRYGRIIGKILVTAQNCLRPTCARSIDAGLSLITQGLAWHYKKYQKEQSLQDRELYSQAEISARSQKIGLWTDVSPIAPWDYRHKK